MTPNQRSQSKLAARKLSTALAPSTVSESWTTTALLVPATVSNPKRAPWATLLATIRAALGPGITIQRGGYPARHHAREHEGEIKVERHGSCLHRNQRRRHTPAFGQQHVVDAAGRAGVDHFQRQARALQGG